MSKLLKRFLPFLYRTQWVTQPGHETEYAFTSGGVEYFCFVDNFNAYADRYFAALDCINALEQRVSREYLETHCQLMQEYLDKGKLSLAAILNHNLRERMNHITNLALLYQLASVWYFDKNENVYRWNPEYAEKKIAHWKKDESQVLDFFFRSPLKQYLPSQPTFSVSMLQTYTRSQNIESLAILKSHLYQLSESNSNPDLISTLKSQVSALESLLIQLE